MNIIDFFQKKIVVDKKIGELKKDLKKNQVDENALSQKVTDLYKAGYDQLTKHHRDWYIIDRFIRGDHWVVFNKSLNTIQVLPQSEGEIRRTVNLVRAQKRSIKNFITRYDPTWEVIPQGVNEKAMDESRNGGIILRYYQNRLDLPRITKNVIDYSLRYSFGIYAIDVEDVDGDGVQDVNIRADDPFDYVFDPFATQIDLSDCRYYVRAIRKPLDSVKNSPIYNKKDNPFRKNLNNLQADNKYASADYKDIQLRKQYLQQPSVNDDDLSTIILYELWIKYTDDKGKTEVKVITKAGQGDNGKIIRMEDTDYSKFPIILYTPEIDPNRIYSEPWLKDSIQINKAIDKLVSHIESYIQKMLNGKLLVRKGSKLSRVTDKQGEFLTYQGPIAPTPLRLEPLPNTPFELISVHRAFNEDILGVHESSYGRLSSSQQSGRSIEALQASDAANLAEATKNLESVYKQIGERIFEILSTKQIVSKTIQLVEGEKINKVTFIGKGVSNPPEGAMVIDKYKVRVQIVPGLAYSEEGKREIIYKLIELKVIDAQFALEALKTSSIGELLERLQKAKDQDFVKEGLLREVSVSSKQGQAPGQGVAQNAVELADQENMEMARGRNVPYTPDEFLTPEHHDLHMAFVGDSKNADKVARGGGRFEDHINEEKQRLAQEGAAPQVKAQTYAGSV